MILCLLLLLAVFPLPMWPSVEPRTTVLEEELRDGYTCRLIEYNAVGQERVQSYLLVPDEASAGNPCPGLVLLHDHGARFDIGKEKLVRPLASAPAHIQASALQWVTDGFDGVFLADRLAAAGYVVIVPDALYWGSRSTELCQAWSRMQFGDAPSEGIRVMKQAVYEGQRAVYDSLARRGIVWAEQTLNEDAAAARLLASLPCVDPQRVGCFGWSMGAHRAWLLGAFCGMAELYGCRDEYRKISLGYRLIPAAWGQGIATEAVLRVIEYLYHETDTGIITASVITENHASANVLRKAGFQMTAAAVPEDWGFPEPRIVDKWFR